jgi:predicted Zn-dependent protease
MSDRIRDSFFEPSAIQALCQQALQRCREGSAEVIFSAEDSALTRFANNTIHQNVAERNASLLVRRFFGQRAGMATTNRLDSQGLDEVIAAAEANARASAEDPNNPGLPAPAAYAQVTAYDPATAAYTAQQRADQVGAVCRLAQEKALNASGAFSSAVESQAVANSAGLFACHTSTRAEFQTVVMAEDASGRAVTASWRAGEIPVESLGREAIEKAERGRLPQPIRPGEYVVVLDPYVVQDLLNLLNMHGMGGDAVREGRSWMNDRLGQAAMSPLVSIYDDGLDPAGLPAPFDYEGVPKQRVEIVRGGVVGEPVHDRYTGRQAGVPSTGHALPPTLRSLGPVAWNLFMTPGESSLEEMIASTRQGLYITRFWYTRLVHPRDCVVTGMTRDGVFWIENGEIAYPVKNLRFTQSYVQALAEAEAVGRQRRLLYSDYGGIATCVPALKVGKFNFTGSTV